MPLLIKFIPLILILTSFQIWFTAYLGKLPSANVWQKITLISANVYAWCGLALVFMPALFPLSFSHFHYVYHTIGQAIVITHPYQTIDSQQIFNVLMTFPAGVYLRLFGVRRLRLRQVILIGLALGLTNEAGQFILDQLVNLGRSVAIDDLLNNALGLVLGFYSLTRLPTLRQLFHLPHSLTQRGHHDSTNQ
ncbi:VanZ family protein [Furfurilactobacillus curtus]